jgi:hypothetical protein
MRAVIDWAAMSDPLRNPQFRRRWRPPDKRESRPCDKAALPKTSRATERPEDNQHRRQSPYRSRDGRESAIGCLVRRAVLKAGGRVKP